MTSQYVYIDGHRYEIVQRYASSFISNHELKNSDQRSLLQRVSKRIVKEIATQLLDNNALIWEDKRDSARDGQVLFGSLVWLKHVPG